MQNKNDIISCYDKTAQNYAFAYMDELQKKHLDKLLLSAFANENAAKGRIIDVGCGPGQTTKYLSDCGIVDLVGVDISSAMIEVASKLNPTLQFETADMLQLPHANHTFGSAIAFYSIVHLDYEQIAVAFQEIKRVLITEGQFLFSFHVGDSLIHLDTFLEHSVNIDFYFFETDKIVEILNDTGFTIIDVIERQPYVGAEHSSRRAYIWVKK